MLLVILIMFGVIFTEATLTYCISQNALLEESTLQLRREFGTLFGSILTLSQAMSGGKDWGDIYDALSPLPSLYKALFLFFQGFTFLALLNVVTAVFVESTMQKAQKDRESLVIEELHDKRQFLDGMKSLFQELDTNGDGQISLRELAEEIKKPGIGAYFASLGVDVNDITMLFGLLDQDNSGAVDVRNS